jgi:uncharacterized protein (DUF1778 family)
MPKKLGRPPKSPAHKRSEQLLLKLTPAERALIVKAADGEPTIWAREVVLRAAKRANQEQGKRQ